MADLSCLWTPGDVHELRVPEAGRYRTISGYFDAPEKLAAAAAEIDRGGHKGVYFTLNPVAPALLARNENRTAPYVKTATQDRDIERRCWLPIDIDPIRLADIPSTDAEHAAALALAAEIREYLSGQGWAPPIEVDSGNGAYLLYPVYLPNDDASTALVTRVLAALGERFDNGTVKIDQTMHNAARIVRVPNTTNRKGSGTADRPHRLAKVVDAPDAPGVVTAEQLAALAPAAVPAHTSKAEAFMAPGAGSRSTFDLDGFIAAHLTDAQGPKTKPDGGRLWTIDTCPFNPDHARGEAYVGQGSRGGLYAGCHHDSCTWEWADLRARFAPRTKTQGATEGEQGATEGEPLSDGHLAERVVAELLGDAYCWAEGLGWLRWDGRRWTRTPRQDVMERVRLWAVRHYRAATEAATAALAAGNLGQAQDHQAVANAWYKVCSRSKLESVVVLAAGVVLVRATALDAHPDLLNVANGVVDLATGTLRDHDPDLLLTKLAPVAYRPDATHPDWTAALEALPTGVRDWYRLRCGQATTGHMTPDDLLVVQQGGGENGKTTVTAGIAAALGDHYLLVSHRALLASPDAHPTELMDFRGARFALLEETPEERRLSVVRLKTLVGTPQITARLIRQDSVTFDASHSLFLSTNYLPMVEETDHGTWRRLALLRFPYTFRKPGEPLAGPHDRAGDPTLRDRIRSGEGGQHEAVLAWLVAGAVAWHKAGRIMPPLPELVAADTLAWRAESDLIMGYLDDRIVIDGISHVMATELLVDFNYWVVARGGRAWSERTFAARFGGHGEVTRRGVDRGPERRSEKLSRATGVNAYGSLVAPPPAPAVYKAWRGLRFRTAADDPDRTDGAATGHPPAEQGKPGSVTAVTDRQVNPYASQNSALTELSVTAVTVTDQLPTTVDHPAPSPAHPVPQSCAHCGGTGGRHQLPNCPGSFPVYPSGS